MTASPSQRTPFVRLVHRDLDLTAYFDAADRMLQRIVPFEVSCWLSLDPATLLPTSHFSREYGVDELLMLAANEFLEEDYNKFADLARGTRPVATLREATEGDLGRSPRHVKFLARYGFGGGDELRAVLRDGDAAWGALVIHRRDSGFSDRDAAAITDLGGLLANGIRRAIIRSAIRNDGEADHAALILLDGDDRIEAASPAARRRLEEIIDSTSERGGVPLVVASAAQSARRAARTGSNELATARIPSRTGGWVRMDASVLDDGERVAVVFSSGVEMAFADLIAQAHGLSARERQVAALTLQGLSTREMATSLNVSAYTVQDHLKSIFEKVGVRSRGELAAHLFRQHCVPRFAAETNGVAATG